MTRTFIEIFKELKDKITQEGYSYECPKYYKDCVQCEFWKRFNYLATNLILLEERK